MTPPGRTRRTPPCRSTRRRNDRQPPNTVRRRVTPAMEPTPTPSGTVEDHRLSAPHSMHRAAPASRAYGRYAVGLPADPGHRRLTAVRPNNGGQRPQKDKQQNTADLTGPAPSGMTTKRPRSARRRVRRPANSSRTDGSLGCADDQDQMQLSWPTGRRIWIRTAHGPLTGRRARARAPMWWHTLSPAARRRRHDDGES